MEEKISKSKYLAITACLCLGLIFNLLYWQSQVIGITLGLAYLFFYSLILGSIFIAKKGWQVILGLILLLSLIATVNAFFIYFLKLNNYSHILILLLLPALMFRPYQKRYHLEKFNLRQTIKKYLDKFSERQEPKVNTLLTIVYLILATGAFYILSLGQVTDSIQSPWQTLPKQWFFLYFLATATLLFYCLNAKRTKLPLILVSIHTFLSSSVAVIIYKIGYGFDPFIHQTAEKIISQAGTIVPQTPYYLGQYGLVLFLQKLTLIPLELIDKILVPVLFALLLPSTIFYVFSHWTKKKYALALAMSALVMPFSGFIMTTPQNLANLFFIITILLSLVYYRDQLPISLLYILGIATIAIHPLAGIPLLIVIVLLQLFKTFYASYHRVVSLYFFTALIFVIFLPLAFITNGSEIIWAWPDVKKSDLMLLNWVDHFNLPLNLVYLINFNKIALASLLITIGLFYIARNKLLKNNVAYLMAATVIFADFIIAKYFLTFSDLRELDSSSFIGRLLTLTFYILLPFFLLGIYVIIKKLWARDIFFKTFLVLALSAAISASLYLSYPRLNNYEPAKFFSLSESDIKAVHYIEGQAAPDHIVLANQMVGVAAIKEFGFRKYYHDQFYYSMPSGNPQTFYEAFLKMTYEGAKRQTMETIMAEAGVSEAYFVLNSYWRNFEKIADQASASADQVINIDNGKILIFKYIKPETKSF